jgi:hypothetical protein
VSWKKPNSPNNKKKMRTLGKFGEFGELISIESHEKKKYMLYIYNVYESIDFNSPTHQKNLQMLYGKSFGGGELTYWRGIRRKGMGYRVRGTGKCKGIGV